MLQIFHKKSSKGFTLIELLVVIAIIGVLASIVLASLNTARRKGRDAKRVGDIKNIQTALEMYFDSCAAYPASLLISATNGCPSGITLGSFLPAIPVGPLTGEIYAYFSESTYTTYHLGATLEEVGNAALKSDRDLDLAGNDTVDGLSTVGGASATACGSEGSITNATDLCFDIVP